MVEILVQGGDKDDVARDMHAAVREIFGIDPLLTHRGGEGRPGTRGWEAALLVLAIPRLFRDGRLVIQQWNRLIAAAEAARKDKDATLLIDTGDGKPIPLQDANRARILQAVKTLEAHLKS